MKKLLLTLFCLAIFSHTAKADFGLGGVDWGEVPPDSVSPWNLELRGSLNGSQASFRNWEQGGVNTVAISVASNFNALYRSKRWGYNVEVGLLYGQAKIDDDFRKTDDEIRIRNTGRYFLEDDRWSIVASVNYDSQFDRGFDNNREFVISRFMSPAYLTETLGISFKPVSYFNIDFGAAAKQTIVLNDGLAGFRGGEPISYRARYGLDEDQSVRNELGFSLLLQLDRELFDNVRYVSTIETFTNANRNPDRSDFRFHNELIGRINNFMNTTLRFTMLYNDDISDKLQLRQTLSVGVSFRLI